MAPHLATEEPEAGPEIRADAGAAPESPRLLSADIDNAMAGLAAVAGLALLGALLWPDQQQRAVASVVALFGLVVATVWLLFRLSAGWLRGR